MRLERVVFQRGEAFVRRAEQILAVQQTHPSNLSGKYFDLSYYDSLAAALKGRFLKIIQSGAENADPAVGAYPMYPDDHEVFEAFVCNVSRRFIDAYPMQPTTSR